MKVIGKEKVDYISKKTNQPVKGITFHCTKKNDYTEGLATETVFISEKWDVYPEVSRIPVGAEIECLYNRFGSVYTVQICK